MERKKPVIRVIMRYHGGDKKGTKEGRVSSTWES
jgi:hypothetical protein